MMQATCIAKFKLDGKSVYTYRLQFPNNTIKDVEHQELRNAIINNKIAVDNIAIASNNRLILSNEEDYNINIAKYAYISSVDLQKINCNKHISFKSNVNIQDLISKAEIIGAIIHKFRENVYGIETDNNIIIATGAQTIVPTTCRNLFYNSSFETIDLTNLDTSSSTSAESMFEQAKARKINVSSMITAKIANMERMFANIKLDELDLSSFDTSSVYNMNETFINSKIKKLNISSFNTKKLMYCKAMFAAFETNELNISNFELSEAREISRMFTNIITKELNIGEFNINDTTILVACNVFSGCSIEKLITTRRSNNRFCIAKNSCNIGNMKNVSHLFDIIF